MKSIKRKVAFATLSLSWGPLHQEPGLLLQEEGGGDQLQQEPGLLLQEEGGGDQLQQEPGLLLMGSHHCFYFGMGSHHKLHYCFYVASSWVTTSSTASLVVSTISSSSWAATITIVHFFTNLVVEWIEQEKIESGGPKSEKGLKIGDERGGSNGPKRGTKRVVQTDPKEVPKGWFKRTQKRYQKGWFKRVNKRGRKE